MSLDDLLIAIIIAGMGLSGVYLKAEYALHVRLKTAQRRTEGVLQALHTFQVRSEWSSVSVRIRTRALAQPPLFRTIGFLARNSRPTA
jgi:hypothetical protein